MFGGKNPSSKNPFDLLEQKQIDSTTYQWAIDQVKENCATELEFKDFLLSNAFIEIIDQCNIPNTMRWQTPTNHLKYPFKSIQVILNPEFRRKLMN